MAKASDMPNQWGGKTSAAQRTKRHSSTVAKDEDSLDNGIEEKRHAFATTLGLWETGVRPLILCLVLARLISLLASTLLDALLPGLVIGSL